MFFKQTIFIILFLVFPLIMLVSGENKSLSLDEFIKLSCKNDKVFQEILKDELMLEYQKVLAFPAGNIIMSVTAQYDLALGEEEESGPQASISLSKLFPKIGTTISAEYSSSFSSIANKNRSQFTFSISQPIARNAFGKANRLLEKIAGIEMDMALHQVVEAYEDYLASLIKTYYSWYSAFANLKTGKVSYKDNLRLLKNIKAKQRNRIALQTDVNKIQLQVLAKRENIVTLSNNYYLLLNLVEQAINHRGKESLIPVEPALYKKTEMSLDEDYKKFTDKSRTYKVLRLLEKQGKMKVDKYANDLLPSANLILGYNIKGEDFKLRGKQSKIFAGIALEHSFFGRHENAQHKISKIELDKTKLSFTNKHRQLYMDINNLYRQMEKEKKLISLADKKISLAKDILKDEKKNYSYGRIKLNDLISAENTLEENKFNKIYHSIQLYTLKIEWLRLTDQLIKKSDIK